MTQLERKSGCKINLILNILGKRPDGFHELETVMHPIPLYDTLVFAITEKPGLELSCDHPSLPVDASNLVYRAASAFLQSAPAKAGVRIRLQKRIPLAAGLGGGSGNAAATLLGLNELFNQPLTAENLNTLAAGLGSDVPFFLQPHPALAMGRGERVQPLASFDCLRDATACLVHPGFGVSTAWAYQALAQFPASLQGEKGRAESFVAMLRRGELELAANCLYNSLEAPVLTKYPILRMYQEFFREHGALGTLMSGSGSTTFALYKDRSAAEKALEQFFGRFGQTCWSAIVPMV